MAELAGRTERIRASARSVADWHDASLRALGVGTRRSAALWSRDRMGPSIYVGAIALASSREQPGLLAEIEQRVQRDPAEPLVVWDLFDELDLTDLGLRRAGWVGESWFREAGTHGPPPSSPAGLRIEQVHDVAGLRAFGEATYAGFETDPTVTAAGPLGMHHPGTLEDPRMRYFVGRVEGRVVSSAIAYVGDDVVGIYGVSTLPAYRRRGYGAAVTWAAATTEPDLPVVLQPDEMARGMYAALGFRKLTAYQAWLRET